MVPPGPDQTERPLHHTRGFKPEAAARVLPAWGAAPWRTSGGSSSRLRRRPRVAVATARNRLSCPAPMATRGPRRPRACPCHRYPPLPIVTHLSPPLPSSGRGQGTPVPPGLVPAPGAGPCPPGARRVLLCAPGARPPVLEMDISSPLTLVQAPAIHPGQWADCRRFKGL